MEDSEDERRRRERNAAARQTFPKYGYSEGISEEENASDHSQRTSPEGIMMSTLSTENLQLELSQCMSDGLSDKETVVKRMKNQASRSPEHILQVRTIHIPSSVGGGGENNDDDDIDNDDGDDN